MKLRPIPFFFGNGMMVIKFYPPDYQLFEEKSAFIDNSMDTKKNRLSFIQNTNGRTRPKQQEVQAAGVSDCDCLT